MGKTKEHVEFSKKFLEESKAIEKGLQKVSEKLIAETKKNNSYLILSNKDDNIKKVSAKDL